MLSIINICIPMGGTSFVTMFVTSFHSISIIVGVSLFIHLFTTGNEDDQLPDTEV